MPIVAIGFNNDFGTNVTFSAQNLPPGLSINPQTGVISGTYLPGTVSPILTPVTVSATDGVHSSHVNFTWTVSDSAGTNRADLAGADGGVISFRFARAGAAESLVLRSCQPGSANRRLRLPARWDQSRSRWPDVRGATPKSPSRRRTVKISIQLLDRLQLRLEQSCSASRAMRSAHVSGGNIVVDLVDGDNRRIQSRVRWHDFGLPGSGPSGNSRRRSATRQPKSRSANR